jgi:hypothetical protein
MLVRARVWVALAATLLATSPAFALPVEVYFSWGSGPSQNVTYDADDLGETANPNGTYSYHGDAAGPSGGWALSWDVTVKQDPFIDAGFVVTNNTDQTRTYQIVFTLPVVPITGSSRSGASVNATLTVDGDGGTLGHSGTEPMFTTLLDGVPFLSLLNHDSSLTVPFAGGSTPTELFGLPGLTQPGPPVASTMGIQLLFTLTPGDTASFTGRFEVVAPEPGTALLLASGLLGLVVMGRRS